MWLSKVQNVTFQLRVAFVSSVLKGMNMSSMMKWTENQFLAHDIKQLSLLRIQKLWFLWTKAIYSFLHAILNCSPSALQLLQWAAKQSGIWKVCASLTFISLLYNANSVRSKLWSVRRNRPGALKSTTYFLSPKESSAEITLDDLSIRQYVLFLCVDASVLIVFESLLAPKESKKNQYEKSGEYITSPVQSIHEPHMDWKNGKTAI